MAFYSSLLFLSLSLCVMMLISPAHSQTCTSQKFNNNKLYTNCSDLPTLNATLHYTYNASNSSLSIAFTAAPSKPDGWVAWAVNLNGTGMAGAQALLAMKSTGGAVVVKKYDIRSYSEINETTKLAVDVWDVSAESSSGKFIIFGSVKVPESVEKLNQIWQVGPAVNNGFPAKHEFAQANLLSKGTLDLAVNTTGSGTNSGNATGNSNSTGAGYRVKEMSVGYQVGLFVLICSVMGFW
ncbi:auxin-induced in root cultures protein 12 [Ricinus communis]|uniref:Auxin-induced in root cultures protein 12, putative n=1 Tax=Ricinus communis TaxID=3988 RepID=B9T494_RICCO|nr:auxin-induced in root cultures protein 12 [Ricinus communis]EEF29333.1 Auxin-induced in root cultures protein 12 precursor, putative [Ricinus communis]|eukprot:XP_002533063.1 auxin-induced in root cultures protein 12 [Ricinus communis]